MSFVVYKSSAGSGKTYTLVKEYLKIALGSVLADRYKGILAITFTNKAANEMKERVIDSLKAISSDAEPQGAVSFLIHDLLKELGISYSELKNRAFLTLEHILHHYSDFSISTIDKFTHRITRTFAQDLKIPMNFEVELDSDSLLSRAINILISKVGEDKNLTKAFVEFVEQKSEDEESTDLEFKLHKFAKNLLNEEGQIHINYLKTKTIAELFTLRDNLIKSIKIFETNLRAIGIEGLETISKNGIEHSAFAGGANGIGKYFTYLKEGNSDKFEPTGTVEKNILADKWYSGKATHTEKNAINSIKHTLNELYYKAQKILNEGYEKYTLYSLAYGNIYPIILLTELEKVIDEIRKEKNIIHISEFNKRISHIVLNEPVPFIYERMGEKYRNFMIDEFQDTSVLQWQNLLPLIDNSLASGNFNMVVGDGKQAIYRWRGGEVSQFSSLPDVPNEFNNPLIQERKESLKRWYKEMNLQQNFRSKREVIEFNNFFFSNLCKNLQGGLSEIYNGLEQHFNSNNIGGYVQVEVISSDNDIEEENTIRVLKIIEESLESGYSLKDIAILCRSNNNASKVASILLNHTINVVSSESLLLENSEKVRFLVSFLKYLDNPSDKIVHLELALFVSRLKNITDINKLLNEIQKTDSLQDLFKSYGVNFEARSYYNLPIYELVDKISRDFELFKLSDPYIAFFLDFVFDYTLTFDNVISGFLEFWEKKKASLSIVVPDGIDAVTIMTIHKSKGLEFPIVIFPFANWRVNKGKDDIWVTLKDDILPEHILLPMNSQLEKTRFSKSYEEENNKSLLDVFNVLYVAFTRPRDRLYVITSDEKNISKYFLDFLSKKEGWNDEKKLFSSGKKVKIENSSKNQPDNAVLNTIISSDWRSKIQISLRAPDYWDTQNFEEGLNFGRLFHLVLARIKTSDDIDPVFNQMLFSGELTSEEIEVLRNKAISLVSNPEVKQFFEKGLNVKNEAEILALDGSSHRPDRVILKDKKAIVIDYKTGAKSKDHIEQLIGYSVLLKELGYSEVDQYLLYTEQEELIKV